MPEGHERLPGHLSPHGRPAPSGKLKPGPGYSAGEVANHQLERIRAAMIELAAERGFDAVTIRELTQRAGVSSRSFYRHYAGKEDCFLEAQRWVAQRGLRKLSESQAEAHNPKRAIGLAVSRLACDWAAMPHEADVLLLSPYRAGDRSQGQLRDVEHLFKARMERSVIGAGFGAATSTLIAGAIVDGLTAVARFRLVSGRVSGLAEDANDLAEWATAYVDPSVAELVRRESDRHPKGEGRFAPAVPRVGPIKDGQVKKANSDLALLLLGAIKLTSNGHRTTTLTSGAIAAAAGISRKRFYANFPDVESCVAAAVTLQITDVTCQIRQEAQGEGTSTTCLYRAANSLCRQLLCKPYLSDVYLGDAFAGMVSAKLQVQSTLADELGALMIEVMPSRAPSKRIAEASLGALWAALRRHSREGRGVSHSPQMVDYFTYLILAPALGGFGALDAMQPERKTSNA